MGWLSTNWLWIALIGAMLLMHLRHAGMHRGHHGHGHDRQTESESGHDGAAVASPDAARATPGHGHGGC